ncbi:bifunctional 4-hydroxy-2-oxoglutarate aldolase/2-dehydro-3-deoxy-phosphogluconate aldolase [Tahibacter amnicola]|uniref:2-dehydro-3-deoxy-phosphogluconate aldolase n=1 Tax=Tahibacter amnicola TaxID=2976241 RepID=A0ABY6BG30_9GAMM|nr:bifunctional 4-hydroxy-2-oxoglutarate aldolase/2-dehydro-3-deoxy-phosphogluconate aldolase [Tahibacter amnicola]UXI68974.1 bifunctional 4-hydroxy-2-oxoglutarate aldolase/2-dehydro-3-deoxy-phosphogluconate aldolase [Tahibacter amnicola]
MSDLVEQKQAQAEAVLRLAPVVAVVVIRRVEQAVPLARALVAGGIPAVEITLRTPVALEAIRAIATEVDEAWVGAGTVLSAQDLHAAAQAGARFAVSPGHSPRLLAAAEDSALPYLPGAATASEAMTLAERGYRLQKFFPAVPAGGVDYLRALSGPLPSVRFCATGGIGAATTAEWLALPNVIAVGGSWLTPPDLVEMENWPAIAALAREASVLRA